MRLDKFSNIFLDNKINNKVVLKHPSTFLTNNIISNKESVMKNDSFSFSLDNNKKQKYDSRGTGYYPYNNKMEGGYVDKKGKPLCTLQDYLDGKTDYVSIALDNNLYKNGTIKYGDKFRIPELEQKYGRYIEFRAVDTGGAFKNKGFSRVDICTKTSKDSMDSTINGKLSLVKI